jgi:DNA-directed RNA polymerase subunit RPC12/RpoP
MNNHKPKRIILAHHADGTTDYVCKKCGNKMTLRDDYHMSFSAGEINETGGEYLQCEHCGEISRDLIRPKGTKITSCGWSDLDEANKKDGHYNRRPNELLAARERMEQARKNEIAVIDAREAGLATELDVISAQMKADEAEKEYQRLSRIYHESFGNHAPIVAGKAAEALNG